MKDGVNGLDDREEGWVSGIRLGVNGCIVIIRVILIIDDIDDVINLVILCMWVLIEDMGYKRELVGVQDKRVVIEQSGLFEPVFNTRFP